MSFRLQVTAILALCPSIAHARWEPGGLELAILVLLLPLIVKFLQAWILLSFTLMPIGLGLYVLDRLPLLGGGCIAFGAWFTWQLFGDRIRDLFERDDDT